MFTCSAKGFNMRAQTAIGTAVWPSTEKLCRHHREPLQDNLLGGYKVLFDRAVRSSARSPIPSPGDTCSSPRLVQSHQPLKCPSPQDKRWKRLELQVESSAGKEVHIHRKEKSCHKASRGGLFASHQKKPECLWKPNEARNCFCMPWSDLHWQPRVGSLFLSNQVPMMKQKFCLHQPPQERPFALSTKQRWPEAICKLLMFTCCM